MLIVFIYGIELLQDSFWTPIVLFLLLLFCEIVPILAMLDYSFYQIIDFEIGSNTNENHLASEERRRNDCNSGMGDEFWLSNKEPWSYADQSTEEITNSERLQTLLLEEDDGIDP